MYHECELQSPKDPFIWITMAMSVGGIPLCVVFWFRAWTGWKKLRNRCNDALATTAAPSLRSAPFENVTHMTCSDPLQKRPSIASARAFEMGKEVTIVHSGRLFERCATAQTSLTTRLKELTLTEVLQLLLLANWVLMTGDQILEVWYNSSVFFQCPHYNCKRQALAHTPGCPASDISFAILYLHPLASCLFVLATINRFIRVYSVLSRPRQLALRVGSAVTIFMTLLRWMAIPLLNQLVYLPSALEEPDPRTNQTALAIYNASFHGLYLTQASINLASMLLGLHYVVQVRSELKTIKEQSAGRASLEGTESGCKSGDTGSAISKDNRTAFPHVQLVRQEKSAAAALFWIACNLAVLAGYLCITTIPEVLNNLPAQFVIAFLTLLMKGFAVNGTLCINATTNLVNERRNVKAALRRMKNSLPTKQ